MASDSSTRHVCAITFEHCKRAVRIFERHRARRRSNRYIFHTVESKIRSFSIYFVFRIANDLHVSDYSIKIFEVEQRFQEFSRLFINADRSNTDFHT